MPQNPRGKVEIVLKCIEFLNKNPDVTVTKAERESAVARAIIRHPKLRCASVAMPTIESFGIPIHRELVTVIEAVSLLVTIERRLFHIVSRKVPLAPWYEVEVLRKMKLKLLHQIQDIE